MPPSSHGGGVFSRPSRQGKSATRRLQRLSDQRRVGLTNQAHASN